MTFLALSTNVLCFCPIASFLTQCEEKVTSKISDKWMKNIRTFIGFFSDVTICAHSPVSLHLLGMSSQPEVFSVHINGQVLQQNGHRVSSVGLISSSTATASMVALHTGRWLISSHTVKHMEGKDTQVSRRHR